MLGSLLATLPLFVLFLVFQKQFVAGLLGGAVKAEVCSGQAEK